MVTFVDTSLSTHGGLKIDKHNIVLFRGNNNFFYEIFFTVLLGTTASYSKPLTDLKSLFFVIEGCATDRSFQK